MIEAVVRRYGHEAQKTIDFIATLEWMNPEDAWVLGFALFCDDTPYFEEEEREASV